MSLRKELLSHGGEKDNKDAIDCVFEIDTDGENSVAPLHVAAANGLENVTNFLLSRGTEVDQTTMLGWTPLMFAARKGNVIITEKLIEYGANVYHKNKLGISVLNMAVASKNEKVIATLHKISEERTPRHDSTISLLHMAALSGQVTSAQLLLSCGHNINALTSSGVTPLMLATASGHAEVVTFLLQHGADTKIRNCLHYSALDIAVAKRFETIVNMFYSTVTQKNFISNECPEISTVPSSHMFEQYGWSLPYIPSLSILSSSVTNISQNDSNINTTLGSASLIAKAPCSHCPKSFQNMNAVPVPPLSPYSQSQVGSSFPQVHFHKKTSQLSKAFHNVSPCDTSSGASWFSNSAPEIISNTLDQKSNISQYSGRHIKHKEMQRRSWSKNVVKRVCLFVSPTRKENLSPATHNSKYTKKNMKMKNYILQAEYATKSFVHTRNENDLSSSKQDISSLFKLLTSLKLQTLIPLFIRHEIDMEVFLTLTQDDLKEMGIECPVVQEKLLTAISIFQKQK